jgi:general secretion pathway protein G
MIAMTYRIPARFRRSQGFTLIEMLVVMALIVVLASVGMIAYKSSVQRGREAVLKEDLYRLRDAIDQYHADKGKYPTDLNELVATSYIRRIPVDPITGSAETWQPVQAEADPSNPTAEPGINDVKSGSEAAATDGTKYAEW